MKIFGSRSSVTINGVSYTGNHISINGDRVIIDGVEQTQTLVGPITVNVQGNCHSVQTASGDVRVAGDVSGDVQTMSGDIDVQGDVKGNATSTSGDIEAGKILGHCRTVSGDITT